MADDAERFESFVERPNTRKLSKLSDAAELGNPNVIDRPWGECDIRNSPGVPDSTIKGYVTIQKPDRPAPSRDSS